MCHGEPDAKAEDGRSVAVDAARFSGSIHGSLGLECTACHTDLVGVELPHPAKLAKVTCTTCHEEAVAKFNTGIHASARRDGANTSAATCVDCHTTHDIRAASDIESTTYALNLPATCSRCHADAKVIAEGHIAIGNVGDLYKDSIHGRAITRSGLLVSANCTSCHGAHDIRKKTDAQSRVFRANIPSTCASCHGGIQAQFQRGSHGAALAAGNAKAPVCTDCHSAHAIQRADIASWKVDTVRECGTCHLDKIKTYRDTFHGQVTSLGFVRTAKCSDCHGAHEVHPKSDPRSLVAPDRVLATCRTCHADATAGFAEYDPHADKDDRDRNPELYYASRFMHWLLIGVFGFFGLHALLWLPRSVAERRRRLQPPPPENSGE
jgi:nitrate/TMAO reductase-like tetraheme cytochrome c subunit